MIHLVCGDCFTKLKELDDNSVDLVIIDPPYFIDQMGEGWDSKSIRESQDKAQVVGGLPVGMKFDPQQGKDLQKFINEVSSELIRILKPGGFYLCFTQARLSHRMAVGIEDAGFEIRDMLYWKRDSQAKAFSQDHFVKKMGLTKEEESGIIQSMNGRKTPQLRQLLEPIVLAQKPKDGTFVQNWIKWGVGLVDTTQSLDGSFPSTVLDVKRDKEKVNHPTPKPIPLMEHLVKLFSKENDIVLDCFMGSGSTGVACVNTNRNFIGIEREQIYFDIALERIMNEQ